ncbi:hypothetical protein BC834DRAFT_845610 [Gloeopeniophorella convolvens]|nr:hypothetical protein BC834DRAFT_845610 [Gloeopeniophorella convolvens]
MTTTTSLQHPLLAVPQPLAKLFSYFPLKTYPPSLPEKTPLTGPLLWIHPPPNTDSLLSADVECLKWQAHLALRGVSGVGVRWDIAREGALGERLPNLQVPSALAPDADGELLPAHNIPAWIDEHVGPLDELEGYADVAARDESHAWIALLEGDVQAALTLAQPEPSFLLHSVLQLPSPTVPRPLETMLSPPPAPLSGLASLLPPYGGPRVAPAAIAARYREAIAALSERLGTDEWLLGSRAPTALDAAAFAYLRVLLHAEDDLRIEVARRVNLIQWEHRVHDLIRASFVPHRAA